MEAKRNKIRKVVRIPNEYLEVVDIANDLFPVLYQFENGLRLSLDNFLSTCYGSEWWEVSLREKLPRVYQYSEDLINKRSAMPWIGSSSRVVVLKIHLITLGQLEEIVKKYQSDCIPELFPTMDFFLGHMEVIKRVRNLYSHMFPCITRQDYRVAKREILTLAIHINSRLPK